MGTMYETDVIAWANEQAALLRAGRFDEIDVEHISDEVEDVGKSEQRELASRMAVLLAHLLKWQFQPSHRGASWEATIRIQRNAIDRRIQKTPSLRFSLSDADWWADAWGDAIESAVKETCIPYTEFPDTCPWTSDQVMCHDFSPCEPGPPSLRMRV
jgi:hypothetical protein